MYNWKKLQNGSDIRGVALDGVEGEQVNLTPAVTATVAKAFVKWLQAKKKVNKLVIAIGTDSRLSGNDLKAAFEDGATECGAVVLDCGLASTPAMFMSTVDDELAVDGGVMITASHLPFNRNGIKFFTSEGGLDNCDIAKILDICASGDIAAPASGGKVVNCAFMKKYCGNLVNYIRKGVNSTDDYEHPLKGMHIIVDAGNGDGGFFANDVLKSLGADISGSQFLEPDGHFPNHIPNPENKEAMQSICSAVIKSKADLGIIFDTDVDRSAIVDKEGEPINRNTLIALIASVILREHPKSIVVTDSVTSDGLTEFIEKNGGIHHRFKRGYKNVINEGIRLNKEGKECWLSIETSGHAALKENYFLDDGAYLAAKLIVEAAKQNKEGKELRDLISDMRQPAESKEIRLNITTDDFKAYGQHVLDELGRTLASEKDWQIVKPNYEGIRVACTAVDENGWFLVRMSLHDPVMPINIESNVKGGVGKIEKRLKVIMAKYDKLK